MTTPETMGVGDKADKVNDDRYLITDLAVEVQSRKQEHVL